MTMLIAGVIQLSELPTLLLVIKSSIERLALKVLLDRIFLFC